MPISATEFLTKYGFDKEEEKRDQSLRHYAMEHARHLKRPHAGTPHDCENWEKYKREHLEELKDID